MGLDPAYPTIEKGRDLTGGQVRVNEPGLTGCPVQLGGKGVRGKQEQRQASGLQQRRGSGEGNYLDS